MHTYYIERKERSVGMDGGRDTYVLQQKQKERKRKKEREKEKE
jgi:hypothetical protein